MDEPNAVDPDLWPCPDRACFEGKLYRPCLTCGGGNEPEDAACPDCRGSGEAPVITCPTCEGAGEMPRAFCRLWEADQQVRRTAPAWGGDNGDHPGITAFSQADYFRRRADLRQTQIAVGLLRQGEPVVLLDTLPPGLVAAFTGFAWGYGGEGPNGLADLLTDAGFFPSLDEALAWIGARDGTRRWTLRKGAVTATRAAHAATNGEAPR